MRHSATALLMSFGLAGAACGNAPRADLTSVMSPSGVCEPLQFATVPALDPGAMMCVADGRGPERYFINAGGRVCMVPSVGVASSSYVDDVRCNITMAKEAGVENELAALFAIDSQGDIRSDSQQAAEVHYHFYRHDGPARYISVGPEFYCIQDVDVAKIEAAHAEILALGVRSQRIASARERCSSLARRHGITISYR